MIDYAKLEVAARESAFRGVLEVELASIEASDSERRCSVPWCDTKVKSNNLCLEGHMNGLDPVVEESR